MTDLLDRVRLGPRVVVLLSGGRDSVCLLDCAARACDDVLALHANYGLRDEADADEAFCRVLCDRLGVEIHVEHPRRPEGNLQAWARDRRYAVGARLALERAADLAAGHTATDQVETVLYRLAASPGRRALLGMREREGRLVRPLLGFTRDETAAHCRARALPWREDASNQDPAYARNRIRHGLVEALREIHPAAEANVLRTLDILRDEAEVLDSHVAAALAGAGGRAGVSLAALRELPPAMRRLAVQHLADAAAGTSAPAVGSRADEILALDAGSVDLGGGLRAVVESGVLRMGVAALGEAAAPAPAEPARLPIPGRVAFDGGEVVAEVGAFPVGDGTLDAAALGGEVEVRAWLPGDRMRPLGLGGSKSLQDLFTDRRVPRSRRAHTPVVVSGGEIAWVPGVATGERFRVTEATQGRVRLAWLGFPP
jgi:tRNA(Ile)-lysidine synthase